MTKFDQKTHLGNAREEQGINDRDPILEAALIAAGHTTLHGHRVDQMRAAIAAVTPHIRQQVAEEIAVALEARFAYPTAARIARKIGAPATECPSCHAHDGQPHTEYCKRPAIFVNSEAFVVPLEDAEEGQ